MYLAPLNYYRFYKRVFSLTHIAKRFLEDFLGQTIDHIEPLEVHHSVTNDDSKIEFDFHCTIGNSEVIIDMQQWYKKRFLRTVSFVL